MYVRAYVWMCVEALQQTLSCCNCGSSSSKQPGLLICLDVNVHAHQPMPATMSLLDTTMWPSMCLHGEFCNKMVGVLLKHRVIGGCSQECVHLYTACQVSVRCGVQDRSGARAKPMTATATSMIKAIWQSYFPSTTEGVPKLCDAVLSSGHHSSRLPSVTISVPQAQLNHNLEHDEGNIAHFAPLIESLLCLHHLMTHGIS